MSISVLPAFPTRKADRAAYISKHFTAYPDVFSSLMDDSDPVYDLTSKSLAALHKKMVQTLDEYNNDAAAKKSDDNGCQEDTQVQDVPQPTNESDTAKDNDVVVEENEVIQDPDLSDGFELTSSTTHATATKAISKKRRKSQLQRKKLPTKKKKLRKIEKPVEKVSTSPSSEDYDSSDSEKTFDCESSSSFVGKETDEELTRNRWKYLCMKFLLPSIKHPSGFKNFGCHLVHYLYFRNESEQRGKFNPTDKFPFSVVDAEGTPHIHFKKFCRDVLVIPMVHFAKIARCGSVKLFKRTLKTNHPRNKDKGKINNEYSKLITQLKITVF